MREVRFLHPILSPGCVPRHLSAGIQVEAVRPLRTCWPLPHPPNEVRGGSGPLIAAAVLRSPARDARSAQRVSESPPRSRRSRIPGILPITSHIHWISWPAVPADDGVMTISSSSTEMSLTRADDPLRCKDLRMAAAPLLHGALPRARQPHKQGSRRPRSHSLSACTLLPVGEDPAAAASRKGIHPFT